MAYSNVDPGSEHYADIMADHARAARLPIHGGLCCYGRARVYTDGSAPEGHGVDMCRRPERAK